MPDPSTPTHLPGSLEYESNLVKLNVGACCRCCTTPEPARPISVETESLRRELRDSYSRDTCRLNEIAKLSRELANARAAADTLAELARSALIPSYDRISTDSEIERDVAMALKAAR